MLNVKKVCFNIFIHNQKINTVDLSKDRWYFIYHTSESLALMAAVKRVHEMNITLKFIHNC